MGTVQRAAQFWDPLDKGPKSGASAGIVETAKASLPRGARVLSKRDVGRTRLCDAVLVVVGFFAASLSSGKKA